MKKGRKSNVFKHSKCFCYYGLIIFFKNVNKFLKKTKHFLVIGVYGFYKMNQPLLDKKILRLISLKGIYCR